MNLQNAATILRQGGIIAYPTEAVFGLGCDPFNQSAVTRIKQLKQRSPQKGLIVIGASWEQLQPFTSTIPKENLMHALATWPGPFTWIFPAADITPKWITGEHTTVAIRVTAHPIAKALCEAFGKAIISTSANLENQSSARTADEVKKIFKGDIDLIIDGALGNQNKPSEIRDVLTGKVLREG
jgi:L-threonylcarbamoyladenylate synthase